MHVPPLVVRLQTGQKGSVLPTLGLSVKPRTVGWGFVHVASPLDIQLQQICHMSYTCRCTLPPSPPPPLSLSLSLLSPSPIHLPLSPQQKLQLGFARNKIRVVYSKKTADYKQTQKAKLSFLFHAMEKCTVSFILSICPLSYQVTSKVMIVDDLLSMPGFKWRVKKQTNKQTNKQQLRSAKTNLDWGGGGGGRGQRKRIKVRMKLLMMQKVWQWVMQRNWGGRGREKGLRWGWSY